jgi:transposase
MEACSGSNYWGRELPLILEDADNGLTEQARYHLHSQLEEWRQHDEAIKALENTIDQQVKRSELGQRLVKIKGVGRKIASAAEAFIGRGQQYHNGRHFTANLGLVPKEHSSGGKQKLGAITRRGNTYLRRLLVQGAWSVIRYADKGEDRLSCWARQLIARRGKHKAAIAVANKLARLRK